MQILLSKNKDKSKKKKSTFSSQPKKDTVLRMKTQSLEISSVSAAVFWALSKSLELLTDTMCSLNFADWEENRSQEIKFLVLWEAFNQTYLKFQTTTWIFQLHESKFLFFYSWVFFLCLPYHTVLMNIHLGSSLTSHADSRSKKYVKARLEIFMFCFSSFSIFYIVYIMCHFWNKCQKL